MRPLSSTLRSPFKASQKLRINLSWNQWLFWASQHTWYYSTHNLIEQSFFREGRDILHSISFQTTFQAMLSFNSTNRIFIGILNKSNPCNQMVPRKPRTNRNLTLETWVFNNILWIIILYTFKHLLHYGLLFPWHFIHFVSQNLQFTP